MLACRDVARSIASEEGRRSPVQNRVLVGAHLIMCRHCRAYRRSLIWIGDAVRALYASDAQAPPSPRLLATLRREVGSPDGPGRP